MTTDAMTAPLPESSSKKVVRFLIWFSIFLGMLGFFTTLRLPKQKIHGTVMGLLQKELSSMGIAVSSESGGVELGWTGLYYKVHGLKLTDVRSNQTLRLQELELSPRILPLLLGRKGVNFEASDGSGNASGNAQLEGELAVLNVDLDKFNLGKIGLFPFLADVQGTTELTGNLNVQLKPEFLNTMNGSGKIQLEKTVIDEQSLFGFRIPRLQIQDGLVDVKIKDGRIDLNQFYLGKGADDITLNSTGNVRVGRAISNTDLDLKVKLGLSPNAMKNFSILDSIWSSFKTPDGKFAFRLNGPIYGALPTPDN